MTKPIHRETKARRRELVAGFVGRPVVTVYQDVHRNGELIIAHAGELTAVAYPLAGTISDQVILRLRPGWTQDGLGTIAISISSVYAIRSHGPDARLVGPEPQEVNEP